jgi:hypothetical protein
MRLRVINAVLKDNSDACRGASSHCRLDFKRIKPTSMHTYICEFLIDQYCQHGESSEHFGLFRKKSCRYAPSNTATLFSLPALK